MFANICIFLCTSYHILCLFSYGVSFFFIDLYMLFICSAKIYWVLQMSLHWGCNSEQWLPLIKLLLKLTGNGKWSHKNAINWVLLLCPIGLLRRFTEATGLPNAIQVVNGRARNSKQTPSTLFMILGTAGDDRCKTLTRGMLVWETWIAAPKCISLKRIVRTTRE